MAEGKQSGNYENDARTILLNTSSILILWNMCASFVKKRP